MRAGLRVLRLWLAVLLTLLGMYYVHLLAVAVRYVVESVGRWRTAASVVEPIRSVHALCWHAWQEIFPVKAERRRLVMRIGSAILRPRSGSFAGLRVI